MTHLDLTFKQALTFIVSRRRAACPNEGFTQQLKAFENSKERESLAQELREMTPHYEEIRQRDLEIVSKVLHGNGAQGNQSQGVHGKARPPPQSNIPIERQAQQNAYRALQHAAGQQGRLIGQAKASGLRIGNGETEGDVGLGWLIKHHPSNRNGTASGSSRGSASSSSVLVQRGPSPPNAAVGRPPVARRAQSNGPPGTSSRTDAAEVVRRMRSANTSSPGPGPKAVSGRPANAASPGPKAGTGRPLEPFQRFLSLEPVLAQHGHSPAARPPPAPKCASMLGR